MNESTRIPRNNLGRVGLSIAVLALIFITLLLLLDLLYGGTSPYLGALTFLVLPGVLSAGIGLMVVGAFLRRRALLRAGQRVELKDYVPWSDWARGDTVRIAWRLAIVAALAMPFLGVMSYEGYHFTESNEFCGTLCHAVMKPEYTAYQQSPHARVSCVDCHIGEGAGWFVKSKLSGARQVYHYAAGSYSRPIPPAIRELRPARETCERCHWPEKFHGDQLMRLPRFSSDEQNTRRDVEMFVKTGGSDVIAGKATGIHWHVASGFEIEFVATDDKLQEIPWIRMTELATGEATVFRSDGESGAEPPPGGTLRVMDCMDCHNRPTHIFRSPSRIVDSLLASEPRFQELPYAKRHLVELMAAPYASQEAAREALGARPTETYAEVDPQEIAMLATQAADLYDVNVFPSMHADWRTYPDNIGHMEAPGCFRCHEGRHVSDAGVTVSHDCQSCHEFLVEAPGEGVGAEPVRRTGNFVHPLELEGTHQELRCSDCHTGGPLPPPTCTGCHAPAAAFRAGEFSGAAALGGLELEAEIMLDVAECRDCHALASTDTGAEVHASCVDCHGDEFYGELLTEWRDDLGPRVAALRGRLAPADAAILDALERAGIYHNPDATSAILDALEARVSAGDGQESEGS